MTTGRVWVVRIEGARVREIGGAPDEDSAMALADDERMRLRIGYSDPWTPWEVEANGIWHANLKDGRDLVCYPPTVTP
jgi:hypothetical protein